MKNSAMVRQQTSPLGLRADDDVVTGWGPSADFQQTQGCLSAVCREAEVMTVSLRSADDFARGRDDAAVSIPPVDAGVRG